MREPKGRYAYKLIVTVPATPENGLPEGGVATRRGVVRCGRDVPAAERSMREPMTLTQDGRTHTVADPDAAELVWDLIAGVRSVKACLVRWEDEQAQEAHP